MTSRNRKPTVISGAGEEQENNFSGDSSILAN